MTCIVECRIQNSCVKMGKIEALFSLFLVVTLLLIPDYHPKPGPDAGRILRGYVLVHLGEVAKEIVAVKDEILRSAIHPGLYMRISAERKRFLEGQILEKCSYIAKALQDLRKLKCLHE